MAARTKPKYIWSVKISYFFIQLFSYLHDAGPTSKWTVTKSKRSKDNHTFLLIFLKRSWNFDRYCIHSGIPAHTRTRNDCVTSTSCCAVTSSASTEYVRYKIFTASTWNRIPGFFCRKFSSGSELVNHYPQEGDIPNYNYRDNYC